MEIDRIYNQDCLVGMKRIPDKSVDAIICDLPYGTTACKWDVVIPFEPLWEQYRRVVKPNAAIVLFGAEPFSSMLRVSNIKWYKYDWIWLKTCPTNHLNAKKQPLRKSENISVFYQQQPTYNPQGLINGVFNNSRPSRSIPKGGNHYIRTYTNEGELVLDNCMGSGTTAIAAMREHRHFIGFENNKEYYNKACERIKNEQAQLRLQL